MFEQNESACVFAESGGDGMDVETGGLLFCAFILKVDAEWSIAEIDNVYRWVE